jgi:hypothetical protein
MSGTYIIASAWTGGLVSQMNTRKKFRADKGKEHPNLDISRDGSRKVMRTPSAGIKPSQTKRKRSERSRSRTPTKRTKINNNDSVPE